MGGGGAGLTASMLLARQGVSHLLVSARPHTSDLPKAHVLNQRALEVLDDVGVAETVAQRSTPPANMAATAYYAGFAGPGTDHGRRLARLEAWGAGGEDENWRVASAWRQLNLPQCALSRCSRPGRRSSRRDGSVSATSWLPWSKTVRPCVRRSATSSGCEYVVRCRYLLGADGGRRVPGLAGIGYEGLGVVAQTATLHVSADFSPW